MNKTIASLAILKVNWDQRKKDYIENFVPFVATLTSTKNYETIETNKICEDFAHEYGLIIPYHAMITILTRAKKRNLIKKHKGQFVPVKDKLAEIDFTSLSKDQLRKQETVMNEFIAFSKKNYREDLTKEMAEFTFISFLKNHDLEILFLNQEKTTILPEIKATKTQKFLMLSFIKHAYEARPEVFRFIVDIAIGHILASALLYSEFDKFKGKLRGINFYLDTGFILRLLGTEGKEREIAYVEFLKILSEEEANLFVFRHTYDEIMGVLETCLRWVEDPYDDPFKASPALRYFRQNNYKATDIERVIVNVYAVLSENKVRVTETPDPNQYRAYQIDERKLRQVIIDTYRKDNPSFTESEKELIMQRDVNSISAIYRLRKGHSPRTIKDAADMFVTTNSALALATRRFEISEKGDRVIMPACLTDVFVGTLVWLESPAKVLSINEKKIIADCSAALQPDNVLIKKYLTEIEKLKTQGRVRQQEYYFLRTHRIAMNLLEEKTMGNPDRFTARTAEEILEEIKETIKKEEQKKYFQEKEKHIKTLGELTSTKSDIGMMGKNIEKRAEQISNIISWTSFGILLLLCVAGIFAQFLPAFLGENKGLRVGLIVITVLLGLMSVATGANIKGLRNTMKGWIKARIIEFLGPKRAVAQKNSDKLPEAGRKRSSDMK